MFANFLHEMDKEKENIASLEEKLPPPWQETPFDATTNFSILGWVLDKLGLRKRSEKAVDFTLEE